MLYPRGFWKWAATPGVLWLILLFVVPFYALVSMAGGSLDPATGLAVPQWNPAYWDRASFRYVFEQLLAPDGVYRVVFVRTLRYVFTAVALCLRDRLPGRLLRVALARPHARHRARAARAAVLDQLPDAHARLGRTAERGRPGEPRAHGHRHPAGPLPVARGQGHHGDPRSRLRLRAVPHPAVVRGARPPAEQLPGGRVGSRRELVQHVPCGSRFRCRRTASSRASRSSCCRCSATSTPPTCCRTGGRARR